jgi:hypothetical protein
MRPTLTSTAIDRHLSGFGYLLLPPDPTLAAFTRQRFKGIRVYELDTPSPCWFVVTDGGSPPTHVPGEARSHVLELTLQVPRSAASAREPDWVWGLMATLVYYLYENDIGFSAAEYIDLGQSVPPGAPSSLVFVADPRLPAIDTTTARVGFLRAVALHSDELSALQAWRGPAFVEVLEEAMPNLMTDLSRPSLLEDVIFAERIKQGIERDGSSFGVRSGHLTIAVGPGGRTATIELAPSIASQVPGAFSSQFPRHRPAVFVDAQSGNERGVLFGPADRAGWRVKEGPVPFLEVLLDDDTAKRLVKALDREETFTDPALPGLTISL